MEDPGNVSSGTGQNTALVILAYLHADCSSRNAEYRKELLSLENDFTRDKNCNGTGIDVLDDGDLETDGHLTSSNLLSFLDDIEPSVELRRNHEEAAALQQVAEELRQIAALLEHNVVAHATQNLRRNLEQYPSDQWRYYLTCEVEGVMSWGTGLEYLPQERVIMALTLALVKGVCKHTPRLLRNLFYTALQYITTSSWAS